MNHSPKTMIPEMAFRMEQEIKAIGIPCVVAPFKDTWKKIEDIGK